VTDPFADVTTAGLNSLGAEYLPGHLGIEILEAHSGEVVARLAIRPHHRAPNGYLHAATVVAIADTACGYGCATSLPAGASGFTTIELKANFLGTMTTGAILCRARMVHGGRTTQLWDAEVTGEGEEGRLLALFHCTQLVLRPR
jgi:1,4-dihydroxy-2-naphthoyl-CoA hydrolase